MRFWRFDIHEGLGTALVGSYSLPLVALSVTLAVLAALAALAVVDRVVVIDRRHGSSSWGWLLVGAFAMGSGIWAMHFTGMLAYKLPVHMNYSLVSTLLSVLPAMIGSWFALSVMTSANLPWWRVQGGGLLMASGIGAMHYTGMEAMILGAEMRYDFGLFVLSIVVAHVLATTSLYVRFRTNQWVYRLLSGVVMGSAVAGMHYTAMAAVRFYPVAESSVPAMLMSPALVAILIGIVALLITGLTVLGAALDQRLMEASDSVHESATRYRKLLETMADGFVVIRKDGTIETLNPAASRMFGLGAEQAEGIPLSRLVDTGEGRGALEHYELTGDAYLSGFEGEVTGRRADGTEFPIDVAFGTMSLLDRKLYACLVRDISEKRGLELQLSHAHKMEAIGQLAAGIAHEINTPIQYVSNNTRFLQEAFQDLIPLVADLGSGTGEDDPADANRFRALRSRARDAEVDYLAEEAPQAIQQCLEGLNRIGTIVQAMNEFSHPATEKSHIDVNQAIESTIAVSSSEWKHVANLETDFDRNLRRVQCIPGDFNQAILNLIVNAAHAIEEARRSESRTGTIRISTREAGRWVEIRVSDNGTGIPQEIRERIFDPFFTTKDVGKGTGQGLSIAHTMIVKKHGGELSVDSEVGKGSCFVIRLPLND